MSDLTCEQAMKLGLAHHRAGRVDEADKLYRQVLAADPNHCDALHLLGVLARQRGQVDLAVQLISRAVAIKPDLAEAYNNLGNALCQQGKLDEAVAAYKRAIHLKGNWPEAHVALANAYKQQGDNQQAIASYMRAIELQPGMLTAYINVGNVLTEEARYEDATIAYRAAIRIKPDLPEAYNNLGNVFWEQKKMDDALTCYAKAVDLRPGFPEANWSMGKILAKRGQTDVALACFRRAVRDNPDNASAHVNLGRMLARAAMREQARAAYERALTLKPDSPEWRFELAALLGDNSLAAAPADYIKDLFDGYASTFDKHLVEDLAYQTPQHLLKAIAEACHRRRFEMVLDLGCGTGLCGQAIRPSAGRLVGVDLSPEMIRLARQRNIYDELITDELLGPLLAGVGQYDLILAGDVLVYVGDLSKLMPAAADALRPGGFFAFSVEHYEGNGYFLHSQERFAHSITYVRQQAEAAGMREVLARQAGLRKQRGQETLGWIVVLQKGE